LDTLRRATPALALLLLALATGCPPPPPTTSDAGTSDSGTATDTKPATVSVAPATLEVFVGGTGQLVATVRNAAGQELSGASVTWSSDATSVATVDGTGKVSGVGVGTAHVTARSGDVSGTATLTVAPAPIAKLEFMPAPPSRLSRGATAQLTVKASDASGNVLTGRAITWTSDAHGVATVSSDGLVTAVDVGTVRITATAEGQSVSATLSVFLPPVVSSVLPASGPVGTLIAVSGQGFGLTQGTSKVELVDTSTGVGVPATVAAWGDQKLTARIPSTLARKTYAVVVTVEGSVSNNNRTFTVNSAPYISKVKPSSAVQGSKITMYLEGYNLDTCAVSINRDGAAAAGFTIDNPGRIVDSSGVPGMPDHLHLDVDVLGTAALGPYAVSCGGSSTELGEENVLTVLTKEGIILPVAGTGTAGLGGDGATAIAARLNGPAGLALGGSGELYIADTGNNRIRVVNLSSRTLVVAQVSVPAGAIATIAGGGGVAGNTDSGYLGDGGPAALAKLNAPSGLAYDRRGLLFIADTGNHCVRVINVGTAAVTLASGSVVPGDIALVAGAGEQRGYNGDGIPALPNSRFREPAGVAVDKDGLLYIADTGNHRLRLVNTAPAPVTNGLGTFASGVVALVAGGAAGYAGDGSQAGAGTQLSGPAGLAFQDGLLYVADTGNNRLRVLNTLTSATVVMGAPTSVGGAGVSVGAGGIAHLAGNGTAAYGGDGQGSLAAQLAAPVGLAAGPFGELYVADQNNSRVRLVVAGAAPLYRANTWYHQSFIDRVAGDGTTGSGLGLGDEGPATAAQLFGPMAVAYSAGDGMLYIADTLHNRVRRVIMNHVRDPYSGELGGWPADFTSGTATLSSLDGTLTYTSAGGAPVTRRFGATGGVFSFSGKLRLYSGTTLNIVGPRPVVLAATGDVQVDGTLVVTAGGLPSSAPGGNYYAGSGHGGAGIPGYACAGSGQTGAMTPGSPAYGNPTLRPISPGATAGTAPGGALVLSAGTPGSSSVLKILGAVNADGTIGSSTAPNAAGGSGGGLRLVASGEVLVSGALSAKAGYIIGTTYSRMCTFSGGPGSSSAGRIQLEAPSIAMTGSANPGVNNTHGEVAPLPWL
jgi:sugar lactone lactonase YvrE